MDSLKIVGETPGFSENDAAGLIEELYGLKGDLERLPSERDQNFRFVADAGGQFVLKIANTHEGREMLEAQNQAMQHIAAETGFSPRVVATAGGEEIVEVGSPSGTKHFVRLVTYLPGMTMAATKRHSKGLLESLGSCVGRIDRALAGFDHPAIHREFHWDLANSPATVAMLKPLVEDPELLEIIERCVSDYGNNIVPLLPQLRKGVTHNDANDHNVIVGGGDELFSRNQRVIGLVDFGDMVHSYTVGDLAVAVAYAILGKPDPLEAAIPVVRGYNDEFPLREEEISAVFGMARMRLCLSVCLAAYQRRQRPEDGYLTISQEQIRETLPKLARIHPRFASAVMFHACGHEPVPKRKRVYGWLQKQAGRMSPVLGKELKGESCAVVDMGIGSALFSGDTEENAEPLLTRRILAQLEEAGAQVGIGGYDEPRALYLIPAFGNDGVHAGEHRSIHIGMDLFAEAGTPVFAPLPGRVKALNDNVKEFDYGPVIVLEHTTDEGDEFYTLYGHLSRESLGGLRVGLEIERGRKLATIGSPTVNGGWTPHLHFQIVMDLLELDCDFPGVCLPRQRAVWRSFCPDPNAIVRVPQDLLPRPEADKSGILAARSRLIGRNLSVGYRDPLVIERGWMQYLYDEDGRRYLDAYNNVPHVGHCHPRVVKAARERMAVLNTNTRYLHKNLQDFAERLGATLPELLRVCFFVNSGSEANELALRLARAHTGWIDTIVLEGAYHGHTTTLIDISPYKHGGPGGKGAPEWVHAAPVADVYRGPFKADDPEAGVKYALEVKRIIDEIHGQGRGLCAYLAETCPSVGGQIVFPQGYLAGVYEHVRAAGGVCIADEVQTGYGRMGTHFYAFEAQGVVPDIVVLGKPIGNGHPLSAVIATPEIAASFDNGMEFFSTFGGNTVSCAVGMAVLDVVLEEGLQSHALAVGKRLLDGLRRLKDKYPIVGDVRGSGLFIGAELVRDQKTLEPAGDEAAFIAERMREEGILLGTDGPFHNVLKIRPPMPFSEGDADMLIATLEKILSEDFGV